MESEQGITKRMALKSTLITNALDTCFSWTLTEAWQKQY